MSRAAVTVVVLIQCATLMSVCWLVGDNGWDDGAITLAFARTFARHGRVALTAQSEIVEGFSSVAWFLLNGLPALARPSYSAAIAISQALSVVCIGACTALLARTCALLRLDKLFSTLTVLTFAAWGCSFSEASNGMEMGLLAAASLLMINELLSPQPRLLLLGAGVVLAVVTRFEALATVGLLALSVVSVPGRRAFWAIVAACLGTVLLLSAWRLVVFSDVLPNTFWAKRWPPYADFHLLARLRGAVELPSLFLAPTLALVIVSARGAGFELGAVVRTRRHAFLILAAPVVGAVLIGALIGKPWGYYGRMPYFAFPAALLLVSLVFSAWVNAGPSPPRVGAVAGLYALSLGASMVGFPSGALAAARAGGSFGVTPHTYAESGRTFRRVAAAADLPHPTVLTPDVGGLALCCDEFRIVDLAMLSNRRLAHDGPGALAEVLESESPDLIEAHWDWASAGKLYELPIFGAHYVPAFVEGTKSWVRRDVAQAIERKGRGCWLAADREDVRAALRTHRYANHDLPADRDAFARPPGVLALDPSYCPGAGKVGEVGKVIGK